MASFRVTHIRTTLRALMVILLISSLGMEAPPSHAQEPNKNAQCEPSSPQKQPPPACLGIGESAAVQERKPKVMSLKTDDRRPLSPRGAFNVLNTTLKLCCADPLTGYERDGFCHTGAHDRGKHTVCAVMTEAFLDYTKSRGNDLSTPHPQYGFPGLKPGDRWCLCALRWAEAERAGYAPLIDLEATHAKTLDYVPLEVLKRYAIKEN